jgi:hypothetical protein
MSLRKAAALAAAAGVVGNLAAAQRGEPTWCMWVRDVTRVDTRPGRIRVVVGSVAALGGWLFHILDVSKRPVR